MLGSNEVSDFSHLFRTTYAELLTKSLEVKKNWFLIIRQARILMDTDHLINDEFTTSRSLQQWIGITYGITDEEGKETLLEATLEELSKGQGQLPHKYNKYFTISEDDMKTYTVTQLKQWFQQVRTARVIFDFHNCTQDEFTYPGAYRDWAGL